MRHFSAPRSFLFATLFGLAGLALTAALAPAPATAQVDLAQYEAMTARNIGPGGMSGRVADVDVQASDPNVVWVGSATGGLWRSDDAGLTWEPMTDDLPTSSIGQVAIFQPNPDIVWVGTGEANPRNSMGVGRGVWKSIDGGRSWEAVGLEGSEHVSRILLHPTDPEVAWVAAMGPAWSDGEHRGVFRTRDGGETWQRVLWANPSTGAADLVMDPTNPNKLIASMWEFRRWPWYFRSGGSGSGLHVTYDGGDTWEELGPDDGLPAGELGRTGLAIAASQPNVVYALVEAERNALLRSDDGGHSWRTVNRDRGINPRPFYYADIRVDPTNENRVYRVAGRLDVSEDGGKSFETVVPSRLIHGDVHDLWLSDDGQTLIQGNDGGVGISYDRGDTWRFVSNLVLAQYYHINVDSMMPYNVLGGMQDNGSWVGPAYVWQQRGIANFDFQRIGGGDGFDVVPDPTDDRYVYGMSQQGSLYRFDKVTGGRYYIQPNHPDPDVRLRFHWNAGIALDPHEPGALYIGSQFLHRTDDRGRSWETLSPDLTTDDPEKQRRDTGGLTYDVTGAENHTTILTIAPSPLEESVIWVGTDDGNVQLTRDGGGSWTNTVDRIRGAPEGAFVPHIEASGHDPAVAYVVFHDYQRGDWTPWVFRTDDYGRSWDRIVEGDDVDGFVRVVEEDPVTPNLLWVGTEFGLWLSLDGGDRWQGWEHGVPTAPVRDAVTHPREHDLVLGTHGRGAFVIDDVRPLQALAGDASVADRSVHLFDPPTAYHHEVAEPMGFRSTGHAMWWGENRPFGARLSIWVGDDASAGDEEPESSVATISVMDAQGAAIRTFEDRLEPGLNRVLWRLETDGVRMPDDDSDAPPPSGPAAPPGDYTVRVAFDGDTASAPIAVRIDPREETLDRADFVAAAETYRQVSELRLGVEETETRIRDLLDGIGLVRDRLEQTDVDGEAAIMERADSAEAALEALLVRLRGDREAQGITDRSATVLSALYGASADVRPGVPTPNQEAGIDRGEAVVTAWLEDADVVFTRVVEPLRAAVDAAGLGLLPDG
ncbi:MAG: hypothetical protein R6U63_16375 [Longimicrobiales bacterium]